MRVLPDLYPSGNKVSVACAHAYVGVASWAIGAVATGIPTGGWGTVAASQGVVFSFEEVIINCARTY